MDPALGVDFIVRGEGDLTFRALLRTIEGTEHWSSIPGLWSSEAPKSFSEIRPGPLHRWTTGM